MKRVKHPSLTVQEMIYNRRRIIAKYNHRKIEEIYYKIMQWLVNKKIDNSYKKERKERCKKK